MTSWQIVCVEKQETDFVRAGIALLRGDNSFIVAVGTTTGHRLTVEDVLQRMDAGDVFYTQTAFAPEPTYVESVERGDGSRFIRSRRNHTTSDNLETLEACAFDPARLLGY